MVDALRVAGGGLFSNAQTAVEPGGAYVVTSSVPVVAYQFNPLRFSTGPITFSQTNDASLLLPTHALTGNYRALTWNTWPYTPFVSYRGFVAVAATTDGTEVTVTSSTTTADGAVGPMTPGQSEVVLLDRGDVLQLLSGPEEAHDLGGTQIAASEPVATFVGVDCRFMPDDQPACDHLEEMAFPLETWGPLVVVSAPEHPNGGIPLMARHRVMARTGGTTVSFDPAVAPDATLGAGEWLEFDSDQDFVVQGSGPISVASVMWGQEATRATSGGDPALATGIPTSQWRREYDFLVPDTYTSNGLNVVREAEAEVRLDGVALDGFVAIGASGYERRRVSVSEGSHRIEGDGRFSITAYGYAQYTSYWYPAGLDLLR